MNEQRTYQSKVTVNGEIIARYGIEAPDRKTAVQKALQWFWKKYEEKYGPASEVVSVGDPYHEVAFKEPFNCHDTGNNYLDETTSLRVIAESKGILERNSKTGSRHHPRCFLRRKKRHRSEYFVTVAPNIQKSNTGRFYYRIVVSPQKSKNGVITQHRKMRDIKLDSATLAEAIEEIREKGLKKINEANARRKNVKVRSLKLVSHKAGLRSLSEDDRLFFAPVLKNSTASRLGW